MGLQQTMRALSDPTRREILQLLRQNSLSFGDIAAHFDMSPPAVSKHLGILKEADLIRDVRQGRYIIYELNASILDEVLLFIKQIREETP